MIFVLMTWLASFFAGNPQMHNMIGGEAMISVESQNQETKGVHRFKNPDTVIALEDTHFRPNK